MDGWRSRMLLATLLFGFGFGFGFSKREGAGIRGIGSLHSFFWLGVAFVLVGSGLRLGCKSTLKDSPSV